MNNNALISISAAVIILTLGALFVLSSSNFVLSQDDAANAVIAEFPALAAYRTTSLPPSSIEGKRAPDGWYLAFIQRGSGVPGILNAHCFYVTNDKKVTATGQYIRPGDAITENVDFETCSPIGEQSPRNTVLPYGDIVLRMGELAMFKGLSILAIGIVEDSRCPVDVQCIQAGTVRVRIEVVSGMGTSTSIVKLGQAFTTEAQRITLTAVAPEKHSQTQITMGDYRLTFNVVPQTTPVADTPSAKCYVGGCSAQMCTDRPDAVSTCEYRESYACYKTATCERQKSGQCGWTPTPQLAACLANS
ncbi:MAG: hypothetical protein AAB480_03645 [Patescibacteria group bacterium]